MWKVEERGIPFCSWHMLLIWACNCPTFSIHLQFFWPWARYMYFTPWQRTPTSAGRPSSQRSEATRMGVSIRPSSQASSLLTIIPSSSSSSIRQLYGDCCTNPYSCAIQFPWQIHTYSPLLILSLGLTITDTPGVTLNNGKQEMGKEHAYESLHFPLSHRPIHGMVLHYGPSREVQVDFLCAKWTHLRVISCVPSCSLQNASIDRVQSP